MRKFTCSFFVIAVLAHSAQAGMMGLGGHHGGFGRGHGGGLGGLNDSETIYSMFEDNFSDLVTQYDEGLAEIEDYYNTDDYTDVVDDVELLSERYDYFLTGVEHALDRFENYLSNLSDEVTLFDELLAKYQADEDLSEERLERLETWITTIQDFLGLKIDYLTAKQSVLSENYATYTAFGDEIDTYLDTIISAGGGTTETEETDTTTTESTASAIAATAMPATSLAAVTAEECLTQLAEAVAVPEPASAALFALMILGVTSRRFGRTS